MPRFQECVNTFKKVHIVSISFTFSYLGHVLDPSDMHINGKANFVKSLHVWESTSAIFYFSESKNESKAKISLK